MKKYLYMCLFLLFIIGTGFARIEIGQEIEIETVKENNFSDYDDKIIDKHTFTIQKTKFYLEGELQKGIVCYLTLQSIGIWGVNDSTTNVVSGNRIRLGHYEYPNFIPWIQHAYISFDDVLKDYNLFPFKITIGKQPLTYGDGIVVDDNGHGMYATRFTGKLPYNLTADYFQAAIMDTQHDQFGANQGFSLKGIVFNWVYKNLRPQFYYITENDKSRMYIIDGDSIKRFYGLRVEALTEQNLYLKFEYIKQGGKVSKDNTDNSFSYDASAYIIGSSATSPKFGGTEIKFEYAYGSGDKNENDFEQYKSEKGFSPLCGRKNKRENKSYYGEIFSQLYYGISNKTIIQFSINTNPYKTLKIGMDYYRLKRNQPSDSFGEEIDLTMSTKYSHSVSIKLVYAFLTPGPALLENGSNISETSFKINYKF